MQGRAQLVSGPGTSLRWDGGDTAALEAFAGDRWTGVNGAGLPQIRGKDGGVHPVRPGWTLFRPDGQDWVIVIAADVWDAWAEAA